MIIQSKKVWIADQFISAAVELEQGKITGIFPYGEKQADVDYGSKRIVPGFMDIHCHGAYEFDTNDAKPEGLRYWAKHIVSEGVTSFLATTVTQSVEVLTNAVANVADVMEGSYEGAEILGIHFEGPYLDMKYKGAQPPEYIAKPSVEQFKHYQQAARGHIRYVTLAPEHDEGFALTHYLTEHGVVVSIGHSAATYEQAVMAYANGARSMTHVYNGMSPFAHRANGLVGAAYRIRTMYGEIICDGCHSTPAALNNYFMSKGPDYAIMISDALMAKGTPIGSESIFGGNHITIYPDGSAHLDNGTLAGSTLNINKGLRILVEEAMVPFNYALNACTINPARCLHLDDRKGSIQIGKDADLVVLDDNYDVLQTYCMGTAQLSFLADANKGCVKPVMIQIAFCDDDQTVLDQLSALLEKYRAQRCVQIQCTAFHSPLDLLAEIEKGTRYDILFLDVIMPAENGITAAKEIRQYDNVVKIIFLTSSAEFAVESYVVGAYFYQIKPIWEDSFFRLTDSVIAECRRADQRSLILRCKTGISRIDLDQLLYCEVLGRTAGHCAVPDKRHRAAGCHRAGRHPAAAAGTGALDRAFGARAVALFAQAAAAVRRGRQRRFLPH